MKKIISIGLVLVVVLSIGAIAFADEVETTFNLGFRRGLDRSEDFERGTGPRVRMSDEDFEAYRADNRINLSLRFEEQAETIQLLSELTGDTVETIQASGLTHHEYAVKEEVLDVFQEKLAVLKEAELSALVEEGSISQEKADFLLERISQMDGTQPQQRLGQASGGRRFNGKCSGFNK